MEPIKKSNKKRILFIISAFIIGGILINHYWGRSKLNQAFDRIKEIESIRFDFSVFFNGHLLSKEKIWREGKGEEIKVRTELEGEKPIISIWNLSKDVVYNYAPSVNSARKTIIDKLASEYSLEGSETSFLEEAEVIRNNTPLFFSRETLDGKDCLVLTFFGSEGIAKHWIWERYGISIRTETSRTLLSRENIEVNIDIPDELFELPPGVEITSKE